MRHGQGGVPTQAASLTLSGEHGTVGEELGFLGQNEIRGGSAQDGLLVGIPRIGIGGFDGPEPFGDPPSVFVNNGAKRLDAAGVGDGAERLDAAGCLGGCRSQPGINPELWLKVLGGWLAGWAA